MVLVILLENDVFKLSIYLDIYLLCVGILHAQSVAASLRLEIYRSIHPDVFAYNLCKQD